MKLPQFLNIIEPGDQTPRAPRALIWLPPSGRPVECPSVEAAQNAATAYAAAKPGHTVAVYQLVGYAFRSVEQPDFTPAGSEKAAAELHNCAPDTLQSSIPVEGSDVRPQRADISADQQDGLERIHEAMLPEDAR